MRPMRADIRFPCMGCDMRVLVEDGERSQGVALEARRRLEEIDARLSRFRPDSELARLNADPRGEVPASALLRAAVRAAVWAAEASDGLVDPTLLPDLERAGYRESLTGIARVPLAAALAEAPARARAHARVERRWCAIRVDDARGTIARPPGLRLDTGGTTKGLAADAAAEAGPNTAARDAGGPSARRYVIDCGGDLRVGAGGGDSFGVEVVHPLTGGVADTVRVRRGAVATSGPGRRIWRRADGSAAHHLLDPATGEPAWTGLISATALAPTALEAETLAKTAVLLGPAGARRALAPRGGVLIHDDGSVERVGPLARPALRVRRTASGLTAVSR